LLYTGAGAFFGGCGPDRSSDPAERPRQRPV